MVNVCHANFQILLFATLVSVADNSLARLNSAACYEMLQKEIFTNITVNYGYIAGSVLNPTQQDVVVDSGLLSTRGKRPKNFEEATSINYTTCNDRCAKAQGVSAFSIYATPCLSGVRILIGPCSHKNSRRGSSHGLLS